MVSGYKRLRLQGFEDKPWRDLQRQRVHRYAREMRDKMTPSEARLWAYLKEGYPSPLYQWAPQRVLCTWYIVDFYCIRRRLIIEVDGAYHDDPEQRLRDETRSEDLRRAGLHVMRFTNDEVDQRLALVLHAIKRRMRLSPARV